MTNDSLLAFLHRFFNRFAQLSSVNTTNVPVNNLAFVVVQKSCGQVAPPFPVDQIDGRLRIRSIEQVGRHCCLHRIKKLRHLVFDLADVVKRDGHKLQSMWPVVLIYLHEIRKLIAAWIAKSRPEVNEQRELSLLS